MMAVALGWVFPVLLAMGLIWGLRAAVYDAFAPEEREPTVLPAMFFLAAGVVSGLMFFLYVLGPWLGG